LPLARKTSRRRINDEKIMASASKMADHRYEDSVAAALGGDIKWRGASGGVLDIA